jgi:hypothetical protein
MRRSWIAIAVLGVAMAFGPTAAPAETVDCPIPGWVSGPGEGLSEDRNGDGFVCVDPQTALVKDNPGGLSSEPRGDSRRDKNGDGWVCFEVDRNVVTDNTGKPVVEGGANGCPDGMQLIPTGNVP